MHRSRTLLAILAAGTFFSAQADAQTAWNREVLAIGTTPVAVAGPQFFDVWVEAAISADPSAAGSDLSTEIVILVNTVEVASVSRSIIIGTAGACSAGPPCSGTCGSAMDGTTTVDMLCYKDGPCGSAVCDCNCGYRFTTGMGTHLLQPEDEIMVLLRPAPGALPDDDDTDDALSVVYHGQPIGWNRSVDEIALRPVAGGGFDVLALGRVGFEGQSGYLDLDFAVDLLVNGLLVSSQNVPAEVDAIYDQGCFTNGCGSACGNVNGVPRYCDPYLWWDCGCVGGWLATFPGVSLFPEDHIEVILRPVPGALPELPGFPESDDERDIVCCQTVAVGDGAAAPMPWNLGQNEPNPFNPMTAIGFSLESSGRVAVDVYDARGRRLARLADRHFRAGDWSVTWDGRTSEGTAAPTGTYFYRLTMDGRSETRKMTLVR